MTWRRTRGTPDVVHVSSAHPTSDVRIHLREAAALVSAGYRVSLVAVDHDVTLPDTGVDVVGLRARTRFQRMTVGSLAAVLVAVRSGAKIVHLHDPELVWAIVPLRLFGRIVIFDAHEDLPMQVLSKPYLPRATRRIVSRLTMLVISLASKSNKVIAATEQIASRFPENKVAVVRNYPRLRATDSRLPDLADRKSNVAYLGAISSDRGALVMVEAFANAEFPATWNAILAGPVYPDDLLAQLRDQPGWERVDYRGHVSADSARDILGDCQIGLCVLKATPAYLEALPTKMFEYFASGIPVIASDFPLWRSIVDEYECGMLVDESSPESVATAVMAYATDPGLLALHSRNALEASRHLNWASEEKTLRSLYTELLPLASSVKRASS